MTDTCYLCGEPNPSALEEHHIVPQRYNGSDEPENTVTLCGTCHNKIEDLYNERFYTEITERDPSEHGGVNQSSGVQVAPEKSTDRELPENSDHFTKREDWEFTLDIAELEQPGERTLSGETAWVYGRRSELLRKYYERMSETRTYIENNIDLPYWDEKGEPYIEMYAEVDDLARHAPVKLHNESSNTMDFEKRKELIKSDELDDELKNINHTEIPRNYYRLHCGYCHTAFSQNQHSDLARHLRLRHGIEDVYNEKGMARLMDDSLGEWRRGGDA